MRQVKGVLLGLVMTMALVACNGCTATELELTAMRSVHKVIAPLYEGYLDDDAALTEPELEIEQAVVDRWASIVAAGDLDAEPAIYDRIAQRFVAYVSNDSMLDEAQRRRRVRLITAWRMRLEEPR